MKPFNELVLVNYFHPDCAPLLNIMRLPREEAFRLAEELAREHPDDTAFGRFADFENYYDIRQRQDAYLHARFIQMGGRPGEEHPLSFVLEGSDYLCGWFGGGVKTILPLCDVEACHISFTIGDSGALFQRHGELEVLTVEGFRRLYEEHDGYQVLLEQAGCHYVEAQLWSDRYVR